MSARALPVAICKCHVPCEWHLCATEKQTGRTEAPDAMKHHTIILGLMFTLENVKEISVCIFKEL